MRAFLISALLLAGDLDPDELAAGTRERVSGRTWNKHVIYLDQGWSSDLIQRFYHTPEGTFLMPYRWAQALVELSGEGSLFKIVQRHGALSDDPSTHNPDGLPVGFAIDDRDDLPKGPWLGVTCAMCHTGELKVGDHRIRIPGGSSPIVYPALLDELYGRLIQVADNEAQFDTFAQSVLGESAEGDRNELKQQLEALLDPMKRFIRERDDNQLLPQVCGPYRLDALAFGAINNALATGRTDPLPRAEDAVSYPSLWHAPWRDHVLYGVRIHSPLPRNLIQALATSMIHPGGKTEFGRHLHFRNLIMTEEWLRDLRPPVWPEDLLGPIDFDLAGRGRELFEQHCRACHSGSRTAPNVDGFSFLRSVEVPPDQLGTDSRMIEKLRRPEFQSRLQSLQNQSARLMGTFFEQAGIREEARIAATLGKPNLWEARRGYGAIALDGIWATPPYLHNGSVATLYDLLLPPEQRPVTFKLGSGEYDVKKVGFASSGSFTFDATKEGNSNSGHTWGTDLPDPDRWALVEYLKSVREWGPERVEP